MKLLLRKIMKVDEYVAMELDDCNNYSAQRPRRENHVSFIISLINKNLFLTGHIGMAVLAYDSRRKVLVNGQHQLQAVMRTAGEIVVLYEEWEVLDEEELSILYRCFDGEPGKSLGDYLHAESDALGIEWKQRVANAVTGAAVQIEGKQNIHKTERVELLKKYIKPGSFVNSIIDNTKTCKTLVRVPVVRAMICTWEKDKDAAHKFWVCVRDGENLNKESPMLVLRNYLMTVVAAGPSATSSVMSSHREMFVKCVHAWNAYRKGEKTILKYHENSPIPRVL